MKSKWLLRNKRNLKYYYRSSPDEIEKEVMEIMSRHFETLHALIIGPGLGRDDTVMNCIKKIIEKAKEKELPLVIDGVGDI
jgi:ATP-dependent NAD(P)H-hydrate dehydratase